MVDSGEYKLDFAMRIVYEEDKASIERAVSQAGSHVTTYSENYTGCKIIEIFDEERYLEQLKDFLWRKNQTLYALLVSINFNDQV